MLEEKEVFYQNATRKLLRQIETLKMGADEKKHAKKLVFLFRNAFKSDEVKNATFGRKIPEFKYAADGMCKASSVAFMNALNPDDWQLMYIDNLWTFGPHIYLSHKPSRAVFDLTEDQYTSSGIVVPYHIGQPITLDKEELLPAKRFVGAVEDFIKQPDR